MKKVIKITKADLTKDNFYKEDGIGSYSKPQDVFVEVAEELGYVFFKKGIYVTGSVVVKAGTGIKAGWGIEAGEGIKAGWGIEAGTGIEAGLSIVCKFALVFKYRLFAGTATFRNTDNEEKKIECGKLQGGTVCYGDVIELGMPKEKAETLSGKEVEVNIDGKMYKAVIK